MFLFIHLDSNYYLVLKGPFLLFLKSRYASGTSWFSSSGNALSSPFLTASSPVTEFLAVSPQRFARAIRPWPSRPRAFCRADVRPTEAPCALNRVSCYLQDALCLLLSTDDDASECGSRSFSCLRVIELLGFRWAFAIKWGWFGPLFFQILFQPLSDLGTPIAHRLVHLVASSRSLKLCSFSFAVFFFFFLFLQCDALSWAVFQRPLPAPILSLHFHRTRSMLSSE